MSLFRISGKFQKDGKWSDQQADFSGYFVQDSRNIIQGYVMEQTPRSRDHQWFIAGIYENDKIVFVKMLPFSDAPSCFVQIDPAGNAYWDNFFPISGGFFANCSFCGHASLSITALEDSTIATKTTRAFTDFVETGASMTHHGILEDLNALRRYWKDELAPHD